MITEIFLLERFEAFVFWHCQTTPAFGDFVSEQRKFFPALHAPLLPFVGQLFTHFNTFESLIDPVF